MIRRLLDNFIALLGNELFCKSRAGGYAKTAERCEREISAPGKSGSSRLAMRTKEVLLPTRDGPSVITTVAGYPVRGRVS